MKKNNPTLLACLVSFLLLIISSCYVPKIVINDGEKWIPKNFNPKIDMLVIESSPSKTQTRKMQKYMEEKYPYKYEFVTTEELGDKKGKCSDKKLYRFILNNASGTLTYASDLYEKAGGTHKVYAATNDFYFSDRDANKMYPETKMAASYPYQSFKNVINVILKKFE